MMPKRPPYKTRMAKAGLLGRDAAIRETPCPLTPPLPEPSRRCSHTMLLYFTHAEMDPGNPLLRICSPSKKKQIFVLPNHMTLPQQLHDKGNATILLEGLGWSGYLDDPANDNRRGAARVRQALLYILHSQNQWSDHMIA